MHYDIDSKHSENEHYYYDEDEGYYDNKGDYAIYTL